MQKINHRTFKFLLIFLSCAPFAQEDGFTYTGQITIINNKCEPWVGDPKGPTKFSVLRPIGTSDYRGCTERLWTNPLAKENGQATVTVVSKVYHVGGTIGCKYWVQPEGTTKDTVFEAGDIVTCSTGDMSVCACKKTGSM